jgi:PAS domain S-box-containing protein
VFDQLSDALVLYSPDFTITGVNRAAEKLFGMASEEMIGRHCQEVFRCGVCESGCGVLVGLNQAPGAPHSTIRLHTDNGMERLVVMRTTQMFEADGRLEGVVATIKDITEEAAPQKREVIAESPPCAKCSISCAAWPPAKPPPSCSKARTAPARI